MKSFIAALRSLVLPFGRTTGRRIVLDGDNGRITGYNAADQAVWQLRTESPALGLAVGASTAPQVGVVADGSTGTVIFLTNRPIENDAAALLAAIGNPGAANEYATLQVQGPSVDGATDRMSLQLNSQNNDGSSEASFTVRHSVLGNLLAVTELVASLEHARLQVVPDASALAAAVIAAAAGHTGLLLQILKGGTTFLQLANDGRLLLTNTASASSAVFVNTAAGHTGNLLREQVDGVDKFTVDKDGVLTVYAGNDFNAWTPSLTGGGAATLSTADGWWQRRGDLIDVWAYFVIGVAGSGATAVQMSLPFTPWRGAANRRQELPGAVRDGGYAAPGPVAGLIFAGGAGATVNRLVDSAGNDVTGAALTAGSIWVFQGTLREA